MNEDVLLGQVQMRAAWHSRADAECAVQPTLNIPDWTVIRRLCRGPATQRPDGVGEALRRSGACPTAARNWDCRWPQTCQCCLCVIHPADQNRRGKGIRCIVLRLRPIGPQAARKRCCVNQQSLAIPQKGYDSVTCGK